MTLSIVGNLTYLLDRYQAETNTSMDANQAEMSIVEIVRAMGSRLLTQWGEQTHAEIAAKHFSKPDLIGKGFQRRSRLPGQIRGSYCRGD